jgi:hypothetical protein
MEDQTRLSTDMLSTIQRQADMQEAAMQQWVEIKNWTIDRVVNIKALFVRYEVVNPTQWPIKIEQIETTIERTKYSSRPALLPPKDPYIVDISVILTPDEERRLKTSQLNLRIQVNITYAKRLGGGLIAQPFGGILVCTSDGATLRSGIPIIPDKQTD